MMIKKTFLMTLASALLLSVSCYTSGTDQTPGEPAATVNDALFLEAANPVDDPDYREVDKDITYKPVLLDPQFIIPSAKLPEGVKCMASNNNVSIAFHEGRLFVAWRTSETHFASKNSKIYIISSADSGRTWDFEHVIKLGSDVREPYLLSCSGQLHFTFFEAGTNPLAFEPKAFWRITRTGQGSWTAPVSAGDPGEVPWEVKVRNGIVWMTSYRGSHYDLSGYGAIDVFFKKSSDGINWRSVNPDKPVVYHGGVSEASFEFDVNGDLWAVTRNEDGDVSGFGSHVAYAPADDMAAWEFPAKSSPERYDSPRMFRHGGEIYLIARRDVGGPFDLGFTWLPFELQRLKNWVAYSLRPKRTALYRINKATRTIEHLLDLPGTADTAFPSIQRTGPHSFLVANYTSPLKHKNWTWIQGQTSLQGTQIYLIELYFMPVD